MPKRAVISVYDKSGVVGFAKGLAKMGYTLISTGGTFRTLKEAGLSVQYVSAVTEFPEILDGRVKTLHPLIHGGILAKDTPDHREQLDQVGGSFIDIVAVNLYPFEAVSQSPSATDEDIIENIDIGGPTMIRAAAKNHQRVLVVSDPRDYDSCLSDVSQGEVSSERRRELAAKAFAHTACYDSLIADYLAVDAFPEEKTVALRKTMDLRYGENPAQAAAFYREVPEAPGLAQAEQLHGKELSFNNIFDADAAWQMVCQFSEPCLAAVKHTNPCGLAVASSLAEAYGKVYQADPVSIFGGIVAANRALDEQAARAIIDSKVFLEIIIAPDFAPEALELLQQKRNLRLLRLAGTPAGGFDWKRVAGGVLIQEADTLDLIEQDLRVVTDKQPDDEQWRDLRFAWRCVKYVKSNAIVVARQQQLLGVGAGQMNRVQSMRLALGQAKERSRGAVIGSDAFFPFADNIEEAAAAGAAAVIQPGGSVRDEEVIAACNKHDMVMVFTGLRHFRH